MMTNKEKNFGQNSQPLFLNLVIYKQNQSCIELLKNEQE